MVSADNFEHFNPQLLIYEAVGNKPKNKKMRIFKKENLGKNTALISLIIGTIIFAFYYFIETPELLLIGYFYLGLAAILNFVVFIFLVFKAQKNKERKTDILKDSAWILVNIPIAFCYLWIIMIVLNTIRLTLINPTQSELTNIHLIGCEEKIINKLEPGEKRTVWISINNDCFINLKFQEDDIERKEIIVGYATSMSGRKMEHKIGKGNQEL